LVTGVTDTYVKKEESGIIFVLKNACKEKNPKKVNTAAHKIKGSSSYMRFSLITKIADQIERESTDAWNNQVEIHLSELKAEWEIVKKIVESKLAQLSNTI
jgi:HPt (histidine-containing phosphotransfer) domain-containing protein